MPEADKKTSPAPYQRINVADVTPRTAPPYATITHVDRSSRFVLTSEDATKLLIGERGVNYFVDGPATRDVIFLRRWDMPPQRGDGYKLR